MLARHTRRGSHRRAEHLHTASGLFQASLGSHCTSVQAALSGGSGRACLRLDGAGARAGRAERVEDDHDGAGGDGEEVVLGPADRGGVGRLLVQHGLPLPGHARRPPAPRAWAAATGAPRGAAGSGGEQDRAADPGPRSELCSGAEAGADGRTHGATVG